MTWILALSSVGLVLWGVGVWSMCRARDEPQRSITVLRYRDRLLVGMQARGETWMYMVESRMLPCIGVAMWSAILNRDLSLTKDDATVMVQAVERYLAAERSVVEQVESIRNLKKGA